MLPNQSQRVISHVDLDAFYTQVEVRMHPQLKGLPVGTVQYNPFGDLRTIAADEPRVFNDSNGSLIAVSYEARARGVKRGMRGDQARKACPELQLVQVPTAHGKADLTLYRDAGKQVVDILSRMSICERASIDECYLDLTEEAHKRLATCHGQPLLPVNPDRVHICGQNGDRAVQDWWDRPPELWQPGELLLACGAAAVADLRAAVAAELGYSCSAGIAHNKILAKLASGMHKPSQQTVIPAPAISGLLKELPISKLRQLGGKFGDELMAKLEVRTVGELAEVPLQRLQGLYGEADAQWLYRLARGCDTEEVKQRTLPKSISCGKTFREHTNLHSMDKVHYWLLELAKELEERVIEDRKANARLPQLLTVNVYSPPTPGQAAPFSQGGTAVGGQLHNGASWQGGTSVTRSCQLRKATAACMAEDATALVKKWTAGQGKWTIVSMFLAVANFAAAPTGASLITRFLKQPKPPPPASHSSTPNKRLENGNLAVAEQEQIGNRLVPADDSVTNSFVSGQQQGLMSGQEDPDAHTTDNMQLHCSRSEEAAVALIGAEQSVCSSQLNTSRSTTLKSDENTGRAAATPQAEVLHAHHRACQLHEQGSKGPDPVQAGLSGISPKLAPSGLQQGTPDPVQLGATGNDPVPAQQSAECIGFTEANNVAIAADRQSPAGPMAQYAAQHNTQCGMQAMTDADRDSNAQPGPGQLRSTLKAGNDSGPACPSKRLRETSGNAEPQHRKQVRRTPAQLGGVDAPVAMNYSEDEIDATVLSELPESIQREIKLSMMSSQKPARKPVPNTSKGMHRFLKPRTSEK